MSFHPTYSLLSSIPLPAAITGLVSEWVPGSSPMSSNRDVAVALALYLATIFSAQNYMKDRKPLKLKAAFMAHNVLLSVGSGLLLLVMVEELLPILAAEGLFGAICNKAAWTSRMEQFYILNYFFKYWELIDTAFLVAKKKPLKFLHVFHHANTALLCFVQLNGRTSVSWVPIVLNLTVHVLMYYYYFATAAGMKIWWKKYLTTMQITQFVIDLGVVYFASYNLFVSHYTPEIPHCGTCTGTETAALFGCGLLTSYLFLFISFYQKTYVKKAPLVRASSADEKAPLLVQRADSNDSVHGSPVMP